jgi:hypothetical protein
MTTSNDLPELPEALAAAAEQAADDAHPLPAWVDDEYGRRYETEGEETADAWLLDQLLTDPALSDIVVRRHCAAAVKRSGLRYILAGKLRYDGDRGAFIPVKQEDQ